VLWRAKQIKHPPFHCCSGSIPLISMTRRRGEMLPVEGTAFALSENIKR
jgi:hypothetical protein